MAPPVGGQGPNGLAKSKSKLRNFSQNARIYTTIEKSNFIFGRMVYGRSEAGGNDQHLSKGKPLPPRPGIRTNRLFECVHVDKLCTNDANGMDCRSFAIS